VSPAHPSSSALRTTIATPHHNAAVTCHHRHPAHCRIRRQGALPHGVAHGLTVLLHEGCHHHLSSSWLVPAIAPSRHFHSRKGEGEGRGCEGIRVINPNPFLLYTSSIIGGGSRRTWAPNGPSWAKRSS
jgi:hypothetical protein